MYSLHTTKYNNQTHSLIGFVPYQHLEHGSTTIPLNLLQPHVDRLEGLVAGYIVHYDDCVCRSVVAVRDGAESLLPSCVPDLELQINHSINLNSTFPYPNISDYIVLYVICIRKFSTFCLLRDHNSDVKLLYSHIYFLVIVMGDMHGNRNTTFKVVTRHSYTMTLTNCSTFQIVLDFYEVFKTTDKYNINQIRRL